MNVILCGYNWAGCKALEILLKDKHNVFVYTHESPYHIPSLEKYCKNINISYSFNNVSNAELPFTPDIICSIYYRYIIKKNIIDACNNKIFNLHPSLLPKYRGCSSLTWAMVNGEVETGFTFHYIDEGCDTGNIILQKPLPIEDWETQETLYMKVMFESMKYFQTAFDLVNQNFVGQTQNEKYTYFSRGCPHNGQIATDWSKEYKARFIRAMTYPPYPVAKYGEKDIYDIDQLDEI